MSGAFAEWAGLSEWAGAFAEWAWCVGGANGGALEYVALVSGYQVLLIVVAGLYVLAYLFAGRWRVLADRGLGTVVRSGTIGPGPLSQPEVP